MRLFKTMSYKRVLPRDLFNEASLLKCLGRLCLLIEEGMAPEGIEMKYRYSECGFDIRMENSTGEIYVHNLHLHLKGERYILCRNLNSREPWPLHLIMDDYDDYEEIEVFDQGGSLSQQFKVWCAQL